MSGLSSKRSPIDRNDVVVRNHCHLQIIPYAGGLYHLARPARVFPGYLGWQVDRAHPCPENGEMLNSSPLYRPRIELRHPLLTASLLLYSTLLLPILLELWLVSATGNANFMYAATMVHSLGCGLGVLDVLGASLRNGVSCETAQLLDADVSRTLAGDENAVTEERGATQITNSVVSAKRVLEERNLVVVQYTTLGDDE